MPNNVKNYLWLDGPQNEVKRFFNTVKTIDVDEYHSDFTFNGLIPMPEHVSNSPNRIEWSIKNWGTIWNAYDIHVNINNQYIEYTTAWTVAKPFLMEVIKQFPDLIIINDFIEEILENAGSFKYNYDCNHSNKLWTMRTSHFSDWKNKNELSSIHSLNLKYSKKSYIDYLNELKEEVSRTDIANAARFYLNLIKGK